jgi:hypothetical protein
MKPIGKLIASRLGIEVSQALYQENGKWFHVLRDFPSALLDRNGIALFTTPGEYYDNPNLKAGKELNVPSGISNLAQYRPFSDDERKQVELLIGKQLINKESAWVEFVRIAKEYHAAQEIFHSPLLRQRYQIERVTKSIKIRRLDAVDSSETIGREKFNTCIERINKMGIPAPKESIYHHVVEEATLVSLLPMLDWSEDGRFIVFVEEDMSENDIDVPYEETGEAPNDNASDRIYAQLRKRLGQKKLRDKLFYLYEGQCAISNCNVREALHACHVIPHHVSGLNLSTNAILLRSDLHDLFDANLLGIDPKSMKIHLSESISNYYSDLNKVINPRKDGLRLEPEGLEQRWELFSRTRDKKD